MTPADATAVPRAELDAVVAELDPGARLVEAHELPGGVSAQMLRLDVVTAAGEQRLAVLRRERDRRSSGDTPDVAIEFGVLAALRERGIAVPEPYLYREHGVPGAPYLLLEWIDGSTEVDARNLAGALEQMARFLREVHRLDPDDLAVPGIPTIDDPSTIDPYLPASGPGDRVRAVLRTGRLATEPNRAVLLHGDYWPGNVVWRAGRLVAVVDWEDTAFGDPLADLATARVELWCAYGADAMKSFTDHYLAHARDDGLALRLDPLPLWELYVSAAALSMMHEWGLPPVEEAQRRERTAQFFDRAARGLDRPGTS